MNIGLGQQATVCIDRKSAARARSARAKKIARSALFDQTEPFHLANDALGEAVVDLREIEILS